MTDTVMFYIGDQCFSGTILSSHSRCHPDQSLVVVRKNSGQKNWSTTLYRIRTDQLIYLRKDQ